MSDENKRLTKEIKLKTKSDNFSCIIGTTNRTQPRVIYIRLNSWSKYTADVKYFKEDCAKLNSFIKNNFKSLLRDNKNISDLFIYTPSIKKTINSNKEIFHVGFEFTLKQNEPINENFKDISTEIEVLVNNIISKIDCAVNFEFHKTKKPPIS